MINNLASQERESMGVSSCPPVLSLAHPWQRILDVALMKPCLGIRPSATYIHQRRFHPTPLLTLWPGCHIKWKIQDCSRAVTNLVAAHESKANAREDDGRDPDCGVRSRARRGNTVNGHGARQDRVDGRHKGRDGGAAHAHLGLSRVPEEIPLHRLAEAGSGWVELPDGLVLLNLTRGHKGRKDEVGRGETEEQRDGEGGGVGGLVRGLEGGDRGEVEDEDAREDETEGEDEDDGVDGAGEGGGVELHSQIGEVAVGQAGRGTVDGG